MECCKIKPANMSFAHHMFVIMLLVAAVLIIEEVTAAFIVRDFKQYMIKHDYAVAGYLDSKGVDAATIAFAFTSEKDETELKTGALILSGSGYDEKVQNRLITDIYGLNKIYAFTVFIIWILFFVSLIAVLYLREAHRNRIIEESANNLRNFINEGVALRLNDCEEGSMSRLFWVINEMAKSLTAHAAREKQNKEFLKNVISDISHQLKTPLAALSIYNEIILEENSENETVESFAKKSSRELNRMETLIQTMLKLARLDSGAIELEKSLNPVRPFLEECISFFKTRAAIEEKEIALTCSDLIKVKFDRIWLGEAIENVIKNALDHTKSWDKIDVCCAETAVNIEINIIDNGSGIHPEDIHHIFKRFYRSRFSKDKEGVGIGLALSKIIIEKHGGTIMVESELGKGTRFSLFFPKITNL